MPRHFTPGRHVASTPPRLLLSPAASPRRSPRLVVTPPSARYVQRRPPRPSTEAADETAPPPHFEPLEPTAGVAALIERFDLVIGEAPLPWKNPARQFSAETLRTGGRRMAHGVTHRWQPVDSQ